MIYLKTFLRLLIFSVVFFFSFTITNACTLEIQEPANGYLGNEGEQVSFIIKASGDCENTEYTGNLEMKYDEGDSYGITDLKEVGRRSLGEYGKDRYFILSYTGVLKNTDKCSSDKCETRIEFDSIGYRNKRLYFTFNACQITSHTVTPSPIPIKYGDKIDVNLNLTDACVKTNRAFDIHAQGGEGQTPVTLGTITADSNNPSGTFTLKDLPTLHAQGALSNTLVPKLVVKDTFNNIETVVGEFSDKNLSVESTKFRQEKRAASATPVSSSGKQEYKCPDGTDTCYFLAGDYVPFIGETDKLSNKKYVDLSGDFSIGKLVNELYRVVVIIAIISSVLMIAYAGFIYMARESPNEKQSAKDRIVNIFFGLILILGIVVFFRFINPNLLNVQPNITPADIKIMGGDPQWAPGTTGQITGVTSPYVLRCTPGNDIAAIAKSYLGKSTYQFGGKGGHAETRKKDGKKEEPCPVSGQICIDCSGYVNQVLECAGKIQNHLGGTSEIFSTSEPKRTMEKKNGKYLVNGKKLAPGDLIGKGGYHVAIYIGNGEFMHATANNGGRTLGKGVQKIDFKSVKKQKWAGSVRFMNK